MNLFVQPGARLMQRLRLLPKFALVSALFLLPLLLVAALLFSELNHAIDATHQRRDGLAAVRQLGTLTGLLQQHRALRHIAFAGDDAAGAQAARIRTALLRQLDALDGQPLFAQAANTTNASALADIRGGWNGIEAGLAAASQKDSYAAHTKLLARVGGLTSSLADSSGLTLDPGIDSYHLASAAVGTFPLVFDNLFEIAGRGAAYIDSGLLEPNEDLLLHSSLTVARRDLARIQAQFDTVFGHNPALRERLAAPLSAAGAAHAFLERARNEVLNSVDQTGGSAFFAAGAASIEGLRAASDAAADALDALLAERAERATWRRNVLALVLLVSVIAAAYLLYGFYASFSHEFGKLQDAIWRAKNGDLASRVSSAARDEIGSLVNAFAAMNAGLVRLVRDVRGSCEAVAATSQDLAADSVELSARTESQASSLEQTAGAMTELTDTVRRNGGHAAHAHRLVASSAQIAARGGESVKEVIATMGAIRDSSSRIKNIIEMIDGIAFQTNILALNAAVEAARAGEQGRGFAVVAAEVRALAQRSAGAAKEIQALIGSSFEQVEAGSRLADAAGATMQEVVGSVADIARIMNDIAAAAREQTQGIEQINEVIGLVGEATQHNAALGEHAAAASASLQQQAARLSGAVAAFRLDAAQPEEVAATQALAGALRVPLIGAAPSAPRSVQWG